MKALERLKFEHYVVAAATAAIFAGVLVFGPRAVRPPGSVEERFQGHSRAVTRSGAKALALLLQRMGAEVVRHERRLDLIAPDVGALFCIAPHRKFERGETDGLVAWIRRGGVFIFLPRLEGPGGQVLARLGLEWIKPTSPGDPAPATLNLSPLFPSLDAPYRIAGAGKARLRMEKEGEVPMTVLAEDEGGWIATGARWGHGAVIVFCDSMIARNDTLIEGDHDALLAHLALAAADGREVAFDEYHHGDSEGQGPLAYVMDTPAGPAVIHGVLILMLILMGTGRRLGPARIIKEERRRRPIEFVEALARLCRASKNSGLALHLVLADVEDTLRHRLGGSDEETIARTAARRGLDPDRAVEALEAAREASERRPSDAELVHRVRQLERLRRKLAPAREK